MRLLHRHYRKRRFKIQCTAFYNWRKNKNFGSLEAAKVDLEQTVGSLEYVVDDATVEKTKMQLKMNKIESELKSQTREFEAPNPNPSANPNPNPTLL